MTRPRLTQKKRSRVASRSPSTRPTYTALPVSSATNSAGFRRQTSALTDVYGSVRSTPAPRDVPGPARTRHRTPSTGRSERRRPPRPIRRSPRRRGARSRSTTPVTRLVTERRPRALTWAFRWWRGQDLNLRPSGYEAFQPSVRLCRRVPNSGPDLRFCVSAGATRSGP
jgi:hypothetical protein